uniref:Ig-like domain-containing protein n=1 Tax=Erpetoichthys calabaricus TaxID=27687 RepID=A0A8C4SXZ2_ERPCA
NFIVVGPPKPVVTYVGEDVVLPASLSPALNAEAFEVRWFTTDIGSPELLYIDYNIRRQSDTRRTLSIDNLKNGNVSLIIRNVRVSDDHLYRCYVYSGQRDDETEVSLTVEGQYYVKPSLSQKTRLECSAEKWNPQPEVTWRDMNGADVTSQSTIKSERDSEGLLRVSSVLPVKEEYNVFSCLMRSKAPKPDWHSRLGIYSTSLIVKKKKKCNEINFNYGDHLGLCRLITNIYRNLCMHFVIMEFCSQGIIVFHFPLSVLNRLYHLLVLLKL